MALEGQIRYRNGRSAPFRGVWTREATGTVRQRFEEYDPQTGEWTDWFTGVYTKTS